MEPLTVVTYPQPIVLSARRIEHDAVPEGSIGVAYYYQDALIARSVVAPESLDAIHDILRTPVSVALAATEDEDGNIDGRVCLVLPVDPDRLGADEADGPDEPWKESVPAPPPEAEQSYHGTGSAESRMVLLPIGNVVRPARDRSRRDDMAYDAREMLENLLAGRSRDAVEKAIDDLLRSI